MIDMRDVTKIYIPEYYAPYPYIMKECLEASSETPCRIVTNFKGAEGRYKTWDVIEFTISDISTANTQLSSIFCIQEAIVENNVTHNRLIYQIWFTKEQGDYKLRWGIGASDPEQHYTLDSTQKNKLNSAISASHKIKVTLTRQNSAILINIRDIDSESNIINKTVQDYTIAADIDYTYVNEPCDIFDCGITGDQTYGKLYRFTAYKNDVKICDMIPVVNNLNSKTGMYDVIRSEFCETQRQYYDEPNNRAYWDYGPATPGITIEYSDVAMEVIKIEDYYHNELRQIWPCYSEGPSNPAAPLVSNAFDYDDTIVWTIGQGVENTASYYYYPITATGQANGVQIALADNPNGWPSDGKPNSSTTYNWYIQAERAGYYQMIMHTKLSAADHLTTGYWSNVNLYVNDSTTDIQKLEKYGDTPDLTNVDYNDVVVAIVPLTGQEDKISFQQSSWRLVIDPTSNIIFREIDGDSPARIELITGSVQTTFTVGDTFSYSGLIVTQYLVDGTSSTISSGYTVSTPDMTTAGQKTITVTYGGLTASYEITVLNVQAAFVVTATLTNSDTKTFEQGTINNIDAVRIPIVNYSSGGYGSEGRVSSTSTDEVYKITPPSAGDYMLVLPIRRGSGNPQWNINGGSSFTVTVNNSVFEYIEILYPITLTAGENTLTIRNSSYRCYFDMTDYVYLVKSSTNPLS